MFTSKKLNIVLLITPVLLLTALYFYWNFVCETGACTYDFRNNFLRPLAQGSIGVALLSFPFLFLPNRYFNSWLKYLFIWAFPLSVVLVVLTRGTGDWLVISKTDVVRLLGIVFGVVTIIFVAAQRFFFRK